MYPSPGFWFHRLFPEWSGLTPVGTSQYTVPTVSLLTRTGRKGESLPRMKRRKNTTPPSLKMMCHSKVHPYNKVILCTSCHLHVIFVALVLVTLFLNSRL